MKLSEAPTGTVAYIGRPENNRLAIKYDDTGWVYLVFDRAVPEDDFRAGWHPLIRDTQYDVEAGDPDLKVDKHGHLLLNAEQQLRFDCAQVAAHSYSGGPGVNMAKLVGMTETLVNYVKNGHYND